MTDKEISEVTKAIVVAALSNSTAPVLNRDEDVCSLYKKVFVTVKECSKGKFKD